MTEGNLIALRESAQAVLSRNNLGAWTKPAPDLYPHQWNWDSCFIAIGLSRYDTEGAETELRSLLRGQWKNGMVPQIVFNPAASGYFPGPEVWQSERSADAPEGVETSGITQPPFLAIAALAVLTHAVDKKAAVGFLAEVYPHLLAFHQFLYRERNPGADGLIVVLHPWESGLDNSPPYVVAGKRVKMSYKPHYRRLDTEHIPGRNRPTDRDYDLYVYLLEQMRAHDWDQQSYLSSAPLQVQDVLFNSILCRANADLARIAEITGESSKLPGEWRDQTAEAINRRLWDEDENTYFSYDRVAGRLLADDTVAGFGPLYGHVAPPERAAKLIGVRLENPKMYWPAAGYPVPTTALDSPWFDVESYWRGPVWVNTNWMIVQGLMDCGRADLAARLSHKTLELVQKSGFREYFNPVTGVGYGADSFSWSAALTIDLLAAMR